MSIVNDGIANDIDTIYDIHTVSANWAQAIDNNSEIAEYMYALGTTSGSDDIVQWTSAGLNTSVTITNLNLTYGQTYYISVKAINLAGLSSPVISSDGFIVSSTNLPLASFYAINDTLYLPNAIALFVNQSQNANSYLWDFGDGTTSTQFNPWHQYTQAGIYTVSLIAMNPPLPNDTLTLANYIKVIDPSTINDYSILKLSIYPNPFSNEINIESSTILNGRIQLVDIVGKVIFENNIINEKQTKISNLNNIEKGHYVLKIFDSEGRIVKNIIVQK
jgi:hypothetical protein